MANFDDNRYNQLAFKAAHNSYQRDEDIHEQLAWNENQPYQGGCRGIEIDFTRHSDGSHGTSLHYFQVSHDKGGSGPPLANYLGYLLAWHLADTSHDPVFVGLDIKSEEGSVEKFPGEFDAYLTEWFAPSLLCKPADVIVPGLDLVRSVEQNGWPCMRDLRGRFLFCLSGTHAWKQYYAEADPTQRLCFADIDVAGTKETSPIGKGNRAIANIHLYSDDYGHWKKLVPDLRGQGLLVRGYVLNSESLWDKAQTSGVNILATDKVSGHDWAKVGSLPFNEAPL